MNAAEIKQHIRLDELVNSLDGCGGALSELRYLADLADSRGVMVEAKRDPAVILFNRDDTGTVILKYTVKVPFVEPPGYDRVTGKVRVR